ncbi:hypothetical protein EUGRSUZ_L00214 [Eucalyptus grandis]|uniref:non-specific serine/threonine protein kinase n=1 Tax=Eucalyptus grandis TaxID=71139 RepID=A0A058ZY59_EUCGR|nr:hypothetical protein EUGRSUZ_L00214 [Eucalyptus grandis]
MILATFVSVTVLNLNSEDLARVVPPHIGNLSFMRKKLFLNNYSFSGKIPSNLSHCSNLLNLDLSVNKLQGNLPTELSSLSKLQRLKLKFNSLTRNIPLLFGNLSSLQVFTIGSNNFGGKNPETLGWVRNLNGLSLSDNKFVSTIPISIFNISTLTNNNHISGVLPSGIGNNFFEGPLPSTISSMRGLQILNVSNNRLSRQIPKYLELLNLTNLSLSYHDFKGALPTIGVFRSVISTSFVGNKKLCRGLPDFQLPKCDYKESKHNKKASASSYSEQGLLHVSYHNLLKAMSGFSSTNLLGMGSFESVYKGLLDQTQSNMAINILDLSHEGASKSFIAECEVLRRIRHRNLVKVLTACSGFDFNGNDFKALVYEFMSNGSLDEWLHPTALQNTERSKLSLLERVNIASNVTCALDYLHHHYETPIVHCDLKTSKVLLDDEMTGHVGDFRLVRFLPEAMHKLPVDKSSSIRVKGSFGYIAAECGLGSVVSIEGDVYSFGVLILEMFIGKRLIDDMFENGLNLHRFAKAALIDRVEKLIDPVLIQEI